eukprot:195632_1
MTRSAFALTALIYILNGSNMYGSSDITCRTGEDCKIICNPMNYGYGAYSCSSRKIIATDALSLSVSCSYAGTSSMGYKYCTGLIIHCPNSTTSECRLSCNSYQCHVAKIIYPQPQNLFVSCHGQYACNGLMISGPKTYSISSIPNNIMASINCGTPGNAHQGSPVGCSGANFDLNYMPTVTIQCYNAYGGTGSTTGACFQNKIYVKYSHNVNISCGYDDCSYSHIDARYVSGALTLNCVDKSSCQRAYVYAAEAQHININCEDSHQSCEKMQVYPNPSSKHTLNVKCIYSWFASGARIDKGCGLEIYVPDNYAIDFMNIIKDDRLDLNLTTTIICETRGSQKVFWNATLQSYRCRGHYGHLYCCPYTYDGFSFPPTLPPELPPTYNPTKQPITYLPSLSPTKLPFMYPSMSPTEKLTKMPTAEPTAMPTITPTTNPSVFPSTNPSFNPSLFPSLAPSNFPTSNPTIFISLYDLLINVSSAQQTLKSNENNTDIPVYTIITVILAFILGSVAIIVVCIYYKRRKKNNMDHVRLKEMEETQKSKVQNAVELTDTQIPTKNGKKKYGQLQDALTSDHLEVTNDKL